MASSKQAGGLHDAKNRNGHAWKEEVFKKCLEDLKRSKRIHEGQRGVKLCLEMFNDAHTKYDNDSGFGPFVADLIVHLTKELKEKAVEQHAFVKRNEELLKRNQKLHQQLASKLAESSSGESDSDALKTKQKHSGQLRWQHQTDCKAFDGKEFAHVEELKRKSQVKRKEVVNAMERDVPKRERFMLRTHGDKVKLALRYDSSTAEAPDNNTSYGTLKKALHCLIPGNVIARICQTHRQP